MWIATKIKRFVNRVRARFCRHEFVLMKNEYNEVSKRMGCCYLWYKCPKCGKMFKSEVSYRGYDSYIPGWCNFKKRM